MPPRTITQTTRGIAASDGDGVSLTRIIASPELDMVDPFLMLDAFGSDDPDDYIRGFPDHPHRGFETVTYLLSGLMRHKDNAGHEGVIAPGGVQWMSAGRGIIHSEIPEQKDGLLFGFQLWINLPASHKMTAPKYQEFPAEKIPVETLDGGTITVIAGTTEGGTTGPVINALTTPLYIDVALEAGRRFHQPVAESHSAIVYMISGQASVAGQSIPHGTLAVLENGDAVDLEVIEDARFLLITGRKLNEPVARHGPFVMNTHEEIRQAVTDYQTGKF